jgi:hypothetical protein
MPPSRQLALGLSLIQPVGVRLLPEQQARKRSLPGQTRAERMQEVVELVFSFWLPF